MADTHSTLRDNSVRLKKNVSKLAFRSKEKVMRTISRTEETKDEIVDHYYMLITKQQLQMQKLQRDMKQYLLAIKVMSTAHKTFFTSLYEVYDDDWAGKNVVHSFSQRIGLLHDDLYARFHSEVTEVLQKHLNEYHEYKFRVEKRGRKLVDYDAARRYLLSLQSVKKPDHVKIDKAEEQVQLARATYEDLNNQLHEQLPALHDSRLPLVVDTFSSISQSERDFYTEIAEMRSKLNNSLLNLKAAFNSGEYHIQRMQPPIDNGRVPPTSSAKSSPPREAKNSPIIRSPTSPADSSQHMNATSAAGSPSSDTSNHEYVNLQVGTMPDVVQPVSEEEESTQSKGQTGGSRDRKYSGQKSDGKENGQSNARARRPASLYVQASSEFSTQPEEKASTKDDGSGQADPSKHKKSATLGADMTKEKSDKDGKKQRSVLGFMSFKKGAKKSSTKTKAKEPAVLLSTPPPPPVSKDESGNPVSKDDNSGDELSENKNMSEEEFMTVKTLEQDTTAVQATVVQEMETIGHNDTGSDATKMSDIGTRHETNADVKEEYNQASPDEFDSDSEQDIDGVFAKYSNEHGEQKPGEEQAMEERNFDAEQHYLIHGEQKSNVAYERANDDLVETISNSELDTVIQERELGVSTFQDQDFSIEATTPDKNIDSGAVDSAFVGSDDDVVPNRSMATLNDAFPLPATSGEDSSFPATSISFGEDLFGSKPFGTVLNENHEECKMDENIIPNPVDINKEPDVYKDPTDAHIQQKVNSGSESEDDRSVGELKHGMTDISAFHDTEHKQVIIPNHNSALTDRQLVDGSEDIAATQDQSKETTTDLSITAIQIAEIAVGTCSNFAVEEKIALDDSVPRYGLKSYAKGDEADDTYEDIEQDLENTMTDDSEAEMSDDLYEDIAEKKSDVGQLGKPEPQSPTPKNKLSDTTVIQPIYEEPPREEDLPSYSKSPKAPELPPMPKSPVKSDNSVDSNRYLDLPPNYLYSVQALYQYRSTDDDELSFEKGEIIHIIKHPDPEEQDDGWQMGVRQKDWEEKADFGSSMGVFPENFSKRIQL